MEVLVSSWAEALVLLFVIEVTERSCVTPHSTKFFNFQFFVDVPARLGLAFVR